jgi:hypothetical protein
VGKAQTDVGAGKSYEVIAKANDPHYNTNNSDPTAAHVSARPPEHVALISQTAEIVSDGMRWRKVRSSLPLTVSKVDVLSFRQMVGLNLEKELMLCIGPKLMKLSS